MMMTGIKEVVELGKNNNEMQLRELMEHAEAKCYDVYGIERTSENSNRASAETLTYQLYDNVAKSIQSEIEVFVNGFLWENYIKPKMAEEYGVVYENSANLYFEFNKPNDPNELAKMTFLEMLLSLLQLLASQS